MFTFMRIYPQSLATTFLLLVLLVAGCDASTEVDPSEMAPSFTPKVTLAADALSADAAAIDIREQVEAALADAAKQVDIEVELVALSISSKGNLTVAGAPIIDPDATSRRGDVLFVMIQPEDQSVEANYYRVVGLNRGGAPQLQVFDLAGRLVRDDETVMTAVSQLVAPCLGGSTEGGTFDDVCKIQGGTPSEECEDCYLFFTCCEKICTPS